MSNANTAAWAAPNSAGETKSPVFSVDQPSAREPSTEEARILQRHAARMSRPDWARTWAFPAYSGVSEFV